MQTNSNYPRRFGRGDRKPSRQQLNEIAERLTRTQRDQQVMVSGQKPTPRSLFEPQQYKIDSVSDDHLVCHTWDGTTEGTTDILVAKPYLLRKTPFHAADYSLTRDGYGYNYSDAQTRTSRRVSDSDDVTEYVTPSYVAGDVIYAIEDISGGVGVEVDEAALFWLDLNVDGRQWSE